MEDNPSRRARGEKVDLAVSMDDVRTIGQRGFDSLASTDAKGSENKGGVSMHDIIGRLLTSADKYYLGQNCLEEVKMWFATLWGFLGVLQKQGMLGDDPNRLKEDVDRICAQLSRRGINVTISE